MNEINFKTETINIIHLHDWDIFVREHYNKKHYSFCLQEGGRPKCSNYLFGIPDIDYGYEVELVDDDFSYSIPFDLNGSELGVKFETWLNTNHEDTRKYFKNEYENSLFWGGYFYPDTKLIFNDLYKKGIIKEGLYMIDLDW